MNPTEEGDRPDKKRVNKEERIKTVLLDLWCPKPPSSLPESTLALTSALERALKHTWTDSQILVCDVRDRRLALNLAASHRRLLMLVLQATIPVLAGEREVRKFARRIFEYLSYLRLFLEGLLVRQKTDDVDVKILQDEAVQSVRMSYMLIVECAVKARRSSATSLDVRKIARGRFLWRLLACLERNSAATGEIDALHMAEAQISERLMLLNESLSQESIAGVDKGDMSGGHSALWQWVMRKTHQRSPTNRPAFGLEVHSGSRESRLFASSESSEFLVRTPVLKSPVVKEPTHKPPQGPPPVLQEARAVQSPLQTNTCVPAQLVRPENPSASSGLPNQERHIFPEPINLPSPLTIHDLPSPLVDERMIASGHLEIPSPLFILPQIGATNGDERSPKGKSPATSPHSSMLIRSLKGIVFGGKKHSSDRKQTKVAQSLEIADNKPTTSSLLAKSPPHSPIRPTSREKHAAYDIRINPSQSDEQLTAQKSAERLAEAFLSVSLNQPRPMMQKSPVKTPSPSKPSNALFAACAICGAELPASSYRTLDGNRKACRKQCQLSQRSNQITTGEQKLTEEELGEAIQTGIIKSCYV